MTPDHPDYQGRRTGEPAPTRVVPSVTVRVPDPSVDLIARLRWHVDRYGHRHVRDHGDHLAAESADTIARLTAERDEARRERDAFLWMLVSRTPEGRWWAVGIGSHSTREAAVAAIYAEAGLPAKEREWEA